ncbi:phage tail assembly protein [Agathobaculum sp. Marseille-P7918]|uniref:phage tail assembly protein n=1 Tax=Agathobaculum sp. Marseille-P7918 TaxID=2479843 RepID=UPI003564CC11
MELQIVYPFQLPKGYLDSEGNLHREGRMRLATAGDEMSALRDPKVKADESYVNAVLLSRVIVNLGTLTEITPETIEGLFISDMEYLQNMYDIINKTDKPQIQVTCPHCGQQFNDTLNFLGAG